MVTCTCRQLRATPQQATSISVQSTNCFDQSTSDVHLGIRGSALSSCNSMSRNKYHRSTGHPQRQLAAPPNVSIASETMRPHAIICLNLCICPKSISLLFLRGQTNCKIWGLRINAHIATKNCVCSCNIVKYMQKLSNTTCYSWIFRPELVFDLDPLTRNSFCFNSMRSGVTLAFSIHNAKPTFLRNARIKHTSANGGLGEGNLVKGRGSNGRCGGSPATNRQAGSRRERGTILSLRQWCLRPISIAP